MRKNKYKDQDVAQGYILFFNKLFDPSPLTSRRTIYINTILQQPNNNTNYPFYVAS